MSNQTQSTSGRGIILFAAIILALGMILGLKGDQAVQAHGGAAVNSIIVILGQNSGNRDQLYVIDTSRQVIGVYANVNNKGLLLTEGRNFGQDLDLIKAAAVGALTPPEGRPGFTAQEVYQLKRTGAFGGN
jgi:hypothetical protein